jgi:hypothetical protein
MDVKELESLIGKPLRIRPEGFGITVTEYMQYYGCGKKTAMEMLESGVEKGLKKEEMLRKGKGGKVAVYYLD